MAKRRILSAIIAGTVAMSAMSFTAMAEAAADDWDGTSDTSWYNAEDTTFTLTTAEQLAGLSELAASGNTFSGKTIVLGADMDFNWQEWTPIEQFSGTLDGGNHAVSNFTLEGTSSRAGFIKNLGQYPATVKNLTLANVVGKASCDQYFAILAANGHTSILTNVHIVNSKIETNHKDAWVGGIYGYFNWTSASNCTVENLEIDASKGAKFIGGFSGNMDQDLECSDVDIKGLKITVSDDDGDCAVGGFTGQTQTGHRQPTFTNCDVTGIDFVVSGTVDVAGFVADPGAHTIANNCTTEGKIDATGVTDSNCSIGGFFADAGWNNNESSKGGHKLTNCSADVDIVTGGAAAGGFIGSVTNDNNRAMAIAFTNCSASGNITVAEGGTANVGGFAGEADRGTYVNCSSAEGLDFVGKYLAQTNSAVKTMTMTNVTPAVDGVYVRSNGGLYDTLDEAVEAAAENDEISMLGSTDTLSSDKAVTIINGTIIGEIPSSVAVANVITVNNKIYGHHEGINHDSEATSVISTIIPGETAIKGLTWRLGELKATTSNVEATGEGSLIYGIIIPYKAEDISDMKVSFE